jgi:inosine-uridine nucleoside N-ribohydrolase
MKRRVIIDNDFAGDPDDLFQLVHHLLSPSIEICGIIGSHLAPGDFFDGSDKTAEHAVAIVNGLLDMMKMRGRHRVYQGSNLPLQNIQKPPTHSDASRFIVEEALRFDESELYIACGGGLTDVAIALMNNPEIEKKIKIIWIGGPEYAARHDQKIEYNLNIDAAAARYVFNKTTAEIWQVPRNAYRQCLVSMAELRNRVLPCGATGAFLYRSITDAFAKLEKAIPTEAETYILGDQPLVLLSALQSFFDPAASSCVWRLEYHRKLTIKGNYARRITRRRINVLETMDTRLMFEDFYLKLAEFSKDNRE